MLPCIVIVPQYHYTHLYMNADTPLFSYVNDGDVSYGLLETVKFLLEEQINNNSPRTDIYIISTLILLRHAFELFLKNILDAERHKYKHTHDLEYLFRKVEKNSTYWLSEKEGIIEELREIVEYFERIDSCFEEEDGKHGVALRYKNNLKHKRILLRNLYRFAEAIERLEDLFFNNKEIMEDMYNASR